MFWNSEYLDPAPSHIDVLLQVQNVRLSDILFEDDLLQELKTSNANLVNFLSKQEIITELVDNIAQLTEKDCCDKLVYSRVHAAYISCEILTSGSSEVFAALMNHPDSLNKIISCLTLLPKQVQKQEPPEEKLVEKPAESPSETPTETPAETLAETLAKTLAETPDDEKAEKAEDADNPKPNHDAEQPASDEKLESSDQANDNNNELEAKLEEQAISTFVPQKATLVSKLINTIHSSAPANLSCHITQDIGSFTTLINLLVQNIDISGSCEILNTFIKRTEPPELRYVFCEILGKLDFVQSLIDVMTLSEVEDKQRNACLLLCDIIVIGRQDASEQTNDSGPMAQDMLSELLESSQAVHVILEQMFSDNMRNSTAIVCGMKVLQKLLEQKSANDGELLAKTIKQTQEEIEKHLIKFHELLLNPPKQQPIKTTYGIIQKPLGYMRLEVVNLIRTLISTNSPNIVKKLVELRTMKVIIDLFIEYSWNNLLHTQVEQALCLIIKNYRRDEEFNYQIDMQQHSHINNHQNNLQPTEASNDSETEGLWTELEKQEQPQQEQEQQQSEVPSAIEIPSKALLSQMLNECDLIGRLLLPDSLKLRNGEQANFGHIIQMINSLAINRDLDTIRDHLNEIKDKRPYLYDRWTTFVNVDVASFKEISLYYDAQSANNNVNHRYGHQISNQLSSNPPKFIDVSNVDEEQLWAFVEENVIPKINCDVFPRMRRANNHQMMYKKPSQ